MTQEIFDSIYRLKLPEKIWKRAKDSLFEDYRQEMYLLLLEIPDDKVQDLVSRGKLADYFCNMCRYQARDKSKFMNKMFGRIETEDLSKIIKWEQYDPTD